MFNVGNNLLSPPLSGLIPGALPGSTLPVGNGFGSTAVAGDGISQAQMPPGDAASAASSWWGSGNGAGGFIQQFMSTIFAALTQMAQYFTSMFGTPPWGQSQFGPSPSPVPTPGGSPPQPVANGPAPQPMPQPVSQQPGGGSGGGSGIGHEQFYSSADINSWGDPHDTFEGTLGDGQTVGGKWSNMHDHPNLLLSNSFFGGFRIATDVSQPNDHGITRNQSATIETDYGRDVVTMNGDGSYSVTKDGKAIDLTVGQAQDLGHGESVTLNANGSLTVVDKNNSGGEITTTLSTKNGGVGIQAEATNVQLGGYLERQGRHMDSPGGGSGQSTTASDAAPTAQPLTGFPPLGNGVQPQSFTPYQPYQPYQPYGSNQPLQTDMPPIDQLLGA